MQRLFAPRRKRRSGGLSVILFAFTFFCVVGAASFVVLLGIRSGMIKQAAPQLRDVALQIGAIDPAICVVNAFNQLDCRTDAVGTPVRLVLGQLRQAEDDLARERELRLAAEEKAKAAMESLRRLADGIQARNHLQASAGRTQPPGQPYVMLPGDTVQPLSKRVTLVYRQPVGADRVLLGSDLWGGDREMEFYKPYRATLDEPGQPVTEVELVVSPAPDWKDGDRSIRLELKPQAEGFSAPE